MLYGKDRFIIGGDKYDLLKIIMVIAVVLLHSHLLFKYISPLLRVIVPIYFMMTSAFFFMKYDQATSDKLSVFKKYVKRNLLLYILWSLFYLPLIIVHKHWFDDGIMLGIVNVARALFLEETFPASWFITASVISIGLLAFMQKYFSETVIWIISIMLYVIALLFSNYSFLIPGLNEIYNTFHKYIGLPHNNFFASMVWINMGRCFVTYTRIKWREVNILPAVVIGFICLYAESLVSGINLVFRL